MSLVEEQIINAFAKGNYSFAVQLLSHVESLKDLRIQSFVPVADTELSNIPLLNLAAWHGWLDTVRKLIFQYRCDPQSTDGQLATPMHYAAGGGRLDVTKFLLIECKCDVMATSIIGSIPLHVACQFGNLHMAKYFIEEYHCNPTRTNELDFTPLHYACQRGQIDTVKYLIKEQHCNPYCQSNDDEQPLHLACKYGGINTVKYLIEEQQCNPLCQNSDGSTPLHYAASNSKTEIVEYLITKHQCDPQHKNNNHSQPLHFACKYGSIDTVKYLIEEWQCDLTSENIQGNYPLHIACYCGHVNIVEYFLSHKKTNTTKRNKLGFTPMMYAANCTNGSQLLSLFAFFGQAKSSIPIHHFVKVGIIGPSGAGKTTLATVIAEYGKAQISSKARIFFSQHVKDVESCTAGIIPSILKSNEFGSMIIHDFAGHSEYYSSHTAILETLCYNSSVVVVNVIDIRDRQKAITHLHYWLTFLKEEIAKSKKEVYIILAGSHKDETVLDLQRRTEFEIQRTASELISAFGGQYVGFVSLDCRKLWSQELVTFRDMLSKSCEEIRNKSNLKDISIYCHILYRFLVEKTKTSYCTLSDLIMLIERDTTVCLPTKNSELASHLLTLHEIGLLFFILNKNVMDQSWIIAQKEFILSEVNGVLFAPKNFRQYKNIASNTGLVTESALKKHFPKYDSHMLSSFLVKMKLCEELEFTILQMITNNLMKVKNDEPPKFGKILFFPALVNIERPAEVKGLFQFGLCLRCHASFQFPVRLLHMLLLHLAYKHALPNKEEHCSNEQSLPAGIFRKCCVWKNGILWNNHNNIKTVVEITSSCKTLLLAIGQESKSIDTTTFAHHRSQLIVEILDLVKEACPTVKFFESLVRPMELRSYRSDAESLLIFSTAEMFESFVKGGKCVVSANGSESLEFSSIFPIEPYTSLHPFHVKQLFDDSNGNKVIPRTLYHDIQSRYGQLLSVREGATYKSMRILLDNVSIFGGRNPFVMAKVDPDSILPLPHAMEKPTLTVDDLRELLVVLEDVTEWRQLGLYLGLKEPVLETVDYEFKKLLDAKREMLKIWLKQDAQVTATGSGANWKSLIIALGKMNYNRVAKMIEDEYVDGCGKQYCSIVECGHGEVGITDS